MKCEHTFHTPLDKTIGEYDNPIACDDCNAISECEHWEKDEYFNCMLCGGLSVDITEPIEYDKYN